MNKTSVLTLMGFIVLSTLTHGQGNEQSKISGSFFPGPTFAALDLADFTQNNKLANHLKTLQASTSEEDRLLAYLAIVPNYGRLGMTEKQTIAVFLAGLNDLNVAIQTQAANRLGGGGFVNNLPEASVREAAIEPLVTVLKDRVHENRVFTCRISDDQIYWSDSVRLRMTVVETLGNIGDERVVAPLLACLTDTNLTLRTLTSVGNLAEAGKFKTILNNAITPIRGFLQAEDRNILVETARTLRRIDSAQAFAIISDMLRTGNPRERAKAAIAMGFFDDEAARTVMMEALKDDTPKVRGNLLWSLSHPNFRKDEAFITLVIPLLKDITPDVRAGAAYSLSCITDKRVVAGVVPLLKDSDAKVRVAAVHAAGRCGDNRVFEHIVALLDDADVNVRYEALMALAALGDVRAIEPIRERMEKHQEIKLNASGVLEQLEKKK
jgi:HEAT repeat protein